jgi:predicted Zn finger-like uncharacterized protein
MPIFIACPSCGVKLDVPDDFLGKKVRCASCSTVFEARPDGPTPSLPPPLPRVDVPEPTPTAELPTAGAVHPQPPPPNREKERPTFVEDDYDDDEDEGEGQGDHSHTRRRIRRDQQPHRGGLILGLGIASTAINSIGCCCQILPVIGIPLGVAALILGLADARKMSEGVMDADGRAMTTAGWICGIVGIGLGCLAMLMCVASIGFNIVGQNGGFRFK